MRILGISGSLHAQSTNTILLQALALVDVPGLAVTFYEELEQLPPFNPDREAELSGHGAIARFRAQLADADVVVFSTPEYAHGLPGSLKNALDWVVGSGELSEKPVALLNASARGTYAQAALREVLTTMNARVLHEAETTIEVSRKQTTAAELAAAPAVADTLRHLLKQLVRLTPLSSSSPHPVR